MKKPNAAGKYEFVQGDLSLMKETRSVDWIADSCSGTSFCQNLRPQLLKDKILEY
jgi:hypothetical protein